jgi:peptide-methionine (R)-S-oxide reductase
MAKRRELLGMAIPAGPGSFGLWPRPRAGEAAQSAGYPVMHTDAEWRSLSARQPTTCLRRLSGKLDFETRAGTYACAGCALPLFSQETKGDRETSWPSFWQPLPHAVAEGNDTIFGMDRTEIHCIRCGGTLAMCFPTALLLPAFDSA